MQVELRLFASLRDRLPGDRRQHRGRGKLEIGAGASLQDLLETLGIEPRLAQMVLVNGEPTGRRPAERSGIVLREGDVVAIFPPLAGG